MRMPASEFLRRRGPWLSIALCLAWGLWGVGAGPAAAGSVAYFALGDSVASGYGLDDDGTACRRSTQAYPWLVAERLQATMAMEAFDLLACAGTTAAGLEGQVSDVLGRLSTGPTLVTLTVGANDFGWSDVFAFAQHLCTPDEGTFQDWAGGLAQSVEDHLVAQLGRLVAFPQVEVILTDYYNPTNASGAFWERLHPRCLFVEVYDRSEAVVHALNAAITGAWERLGSHGFVQVATVHEAFHGHEAPRLACGTAPPEVEDTWVQYPGDPDSTATPVGGDCFHPNRPAAERYAEAVAALVPPDLGRPLRLRVNDSNLSPGETLTLTATITPDAAPMVVDLYVALEFPDQRLEFLQADGRLSPEVEPYLRQWPVAPFRAELFRAPLTGAEPAGPYRWLATFTEPGAQTPVGTIAEAPFMITP